MPSKNDIKRVNRALRNNPRGRVKPGPPKDGRLRNNKSGKYPK